MQLSFRPLTITDKDSIRQITLNAGLRNCNFSFGNLYGWSHLFKTEVCLLDNIVVFRYHFGDNISHAIASATPPDNELLMSLRKDPGNNGSSLRLTTVEDTWVNELESRDAIEVTSTAVRDSYDYIYLRSELENLQGKDFKAKRNHVNNFMTEHPDYKYRELTPALFDRCMMLEHLWRDGAPHQNPLWGDAIDAEQQVMERIFNSWDQLDMIGGAIFVGDEMVAFSYGNAITNDTFDVCVEKADRTINGAFNIINQQLVKHLPEQFIYINREEDMGLEGLRRAKLSYNPHYLLSYNSVEINM